MKKVLYLTDFVDIGGGESSLINMIHYFQTQGMLKPILVVPKEGELTRICKGLNIEFIVIPFAMKSRAWLKFIPIVPPIAWWRLLSFIRQRQIDLIHVNSSSFALTTSLIPAKFLKKRLIWTCHGWWEKPYGLRAKVLNRFVAKVFVVSDYVRKFVEFPHDKVETTYLGVPVNNKIEKKSNLKLADTPNLKCITIGVVGRYQPVKNQLLFVEAADEMLSSDKRGNYYFVLIGDVSFNKQSQKYKDKVVQRINQSPNKDRIRLLGFERDMDSIYQALDILVVPSEFESFSMATVEAMAEGLKVVATDCGGPSEIIEDGKNGFLFRSGDKGDLVLKITQALNSPDQVKEQAVIRARDFSIEKIGKKICEEYKKLWGEE